MCFSLFFIALSLSLSLSCSFSVSSLPSCDAHFWDVVSCKDRTGSSVMFQSASSDLTRQLSKNPEGRLNVFSCFFFVRKSPIMVDKFVRFALTQRKNGHSMEMDAPVLNHRLSKPNILRNIWITDWTITTLSGLRYKRRLGQDQPSVDFG